MSYDLDHDSTNLSTVGVFRAARQFWWIVLAMLAVGIALGLGYSSMQETLYEATARILLTTSNDPDTDATRNPERRLANEVERLRSPEVVQEAATLLDDGTTPSQIRGSLSVSGGGDVDLLQVVVSRPSADEAAAWANATLEGYQTVVVRSTRATIQSEVDELTAARDQLAQQISEANGRIGEIRNAAEAQAREVYRFAEDIRADVELRIEADPEYNQLAARVESDELALADTQARIADATNRLNLADAGVEIAETAQVPSSPAQPKPARNAAVGGLIGLLLGVAIAWWRADALAPVDGRRAAQVLEVPQYGVLPAKRGLTSGGAIDLAATSPFAGSGRVVATALAYRMLARPSATILISSVWRGEGRTLTTLTTGVALARTGKSVLLIDGDPEARGLSKATNADASLGVTELASGQASLDEALHRLPYPNTPTAWLISAGVATLPHAPNLPSVVQGVLRRMDYVLIDGPPLLTSPDAIELAAEADGVILVVAEDTSTSDLEEARQRLDLVDSQLLGFVMNPYHQSRPTPLVVEEMRTIGAAPIAELPPMVVPDRHQRHREQERGRGDDRGTGVDRAGTGTSSRNERTPHDAYDRPEPRPASGERDGTTEAWAEPERPRRFFSVDLPDD